MFLHVATSRLGLVAAALGLALSGPLAIVSATPAVAKKATATKKKRVYKRPRQRMLDYRPGVNDHLPARRFGSRFPPQYGNYPAWAADAFSRQNELYERDN
ncbi:MAG: hypothetical protein AAF732_05205 [Pseudomonadota bacterium]